MTTARREWTELPSSLRSEVEKVLGGSVIRFTPTSGGFSVGSVTGIVEGSNRESLFIKAVPSDHEFVADYRTEARIASALPTNVTYPRARLFLDAKRWVLFASDAVIGHIPHEPWQDDELAAALASLTATSRALTPAPLVDVPTVAERMASRCQTWATLANRGEHGPVRLTNLNNWERAHLNELADIEGRWQRGASGNTLLHFDLRYDNCIIDQSDLAIFVDWGRACLGQDWIDLVCLLLESNLGERDPESIFLGHPLGSTADESSVTAFLVALASYWTYAAALPPVDGAPALRNRQEYSRRATIEWLQRRWPA